jgi:hypothetical protein
MQSASGLRLRTAWRKFAQIVVGRGIGVIVIDSILCALELKEYLF